MSNERLALLARRAEMQQRLKDQAIRSEMAPLLSELAALGAEPRVLWPGPEADEHAAWIADRFPLLMHGVDWQAVAGAQSCDYTDDEDRAGRFAARVLAQAGAGGQARELVVSWPGCVPCALALPAVEVARCAIPLLAADFDTFCHAGDARWLIECHHDSRIWWGEAPV